MPVRMQRQQQYRGGEILRLVQARNAPHQGNIERKIEASPRRDGGRVRSLWLEPMIDPHQTIAIARRMRGIFVGDRLRVDHDAIEQAGRSEHEVERARPCRLERAGRDAIGDHRAGTGETRRDRAKQIAVVLEGQHGTRPHRAHVAQQVADHAEQRAEVRGPLGRAEMRIRLLVESAGAAEEEDVMHLVSARREAMPEDAGDLLRAGAFRLGLHQHHSSITGRRRALRRVDPA